MDENSNQEMSSISKADSDEKLGEFWDAHDFTAYDDPSRPDAEFEVTCVVPIELELFTALEEQAHKRGVQVETLVNLWLQQKLAEQSAAKAV